MEFKLLLEWVKKLLNLQHKWNCQSIETCCLLSQLPSSPSLDVFKLNTLNTYTSQNVNTILCLLSNTRGSKSSRPIQKHFVPTSDVLPIHLRWGHYFIFPFRLWSFLTIRLRLLALHLQAQLWIQLSAAPSSLGCVTHQPVDDKTSTKNWTHAALWRSRCRAAV